jgi:hypothetical protein
MDMYQNRSTLKVINDSSLLKQNTNGHEASNVLKYAHSCMVYDVY